MKEYKVRKGNTIKIVNESELPKYLAIGWEQIENNEDKIRENPYLSSLNLSK